MMQSMKTFTNSAIKRGVASVAIVAGSMLLHGCDPLVDLALDCIDRDGPEFDKTLLACSG